MRSGVRGVRCRRAHPERKDEAGEVDLSLVACRRLEANLKGLGSLARPDGRNEALHGRISTEIAALAPLARQPDRAEVEESRDALAKIVEVGALERSQIRRRSRDCQESCVRGHSEAAGGELWQSRRV